MTMPGAAEMWNERYAQPFTSYGTEPNDYLREVADRIPEGPVLCLAEGEGRNAVYLAGRGHSVTAVDLSEVGLANARDLATRHGVRIETVVADITELDMGERRWSGIVSIWGHLPSALRPGVHAACARAATRRCVRARGLYASAPRSARGRGAAGGGRDAHPGGVAPRPERAAAGALPGGRPRYRRGGVPSRAQYDRAGPGRQAEWRQRHGHATIVARSTRSGSPRGGPGWTLSP